MLAAMFLAAATAAAAQTATAPRLEPLPMAGALIPTGEQRDLFQDAAMYGAQVALEYRPNLHLLGTELQSGVVALRLEARDYVSCFKNALTSESKTRNEVGLSAGFAYHIGRRLR
jgi:hypothetical protein